MIVMPEPSSASAAPVAATDGLGRRFGRTPHKSSTLQADAGTERREPHGSGSSRSHCLRQEPRWPPISSTPSSEADHALTNWPARSSSRDIFHPKATFPRNPGV